MASIKKNLGYNFILTLSRVLLPLLSIPYISRVLDPEGIGKVSFIDSFTYYFIFIAEFGIIMYGIREVAKRSSDKPARNKLVSELLVLHLITSSVALVIYAVAVIILWHKFGDGRLVLFSLSYLLVNSFACEWYFMGMERFRYITNRSLITRILALGSLFILVKAPEDYYIYYAIMVVAAIANLIWNNINLFREVDISFRKVQWKKHIRYTGITNGINLAFGITLVLDNVLLRFVSSAAVVGIYAFSSKMVRMISGLFTDTLTVFFSRVVVLQQQGRELHAREMMQKNLQLLIFFTVPACAGFFLTARPLVNIFLGPQFEEAILCVQLLAAFPLLKSINLFFCNVVLIAHHKEKLAFWSILTGNLIFIPLTLLLSYQWQFTGAAIALMIAELIVLIVAGIFSSRIFPGFDFVQPYTLAQALLVSLFFWPVFVLLKYLGLSDPMMLGIAIPVCAALYICLQLFVVKNSFVSEIWQWFIRKKVRNP